MRGRGGSPLPSPSIDQLQGHADDCSWSIRTLFGLAYIDKLPFIIFFLKGRWNVRICSSLSSKVLPTNLMVAVSRRKYEDFQVFSFFSLSLPQQRLTHTSNAMYLSAHFFPYGFQTERLRKLSARPVSTPSSPSTASTTSHLISKTTEAGLKKAMAGGPRDILTA